MAFEQIDDEKLKERVIHINRVAKVVKGGRRFSLRGARRRRATRRGTSASVWARRTRSPRPSARGTTRRGRTSSGFRSSGVTIPHEVLGHFGAGEVFLKPASAGTGVIAGGAVRAVVESAGIHDILTKCIGSANPHNVVRATITALKALRSVEQIASKRGKQTMDVLTLDPKKAAAKAAISSARLPEVTP